MLRRASAVQGPERGSAKNNVVRHCGGLAFISGLLSCLFLISNVQCVDLNSAVGDAPSSPQLLHATRGQRESADASFEATAVVAKSTTETGVSADTSHLQIWARQRRKLFRKRRVWDRLEAARLLQQYFRNSQVDTSQAEIPVDLEARILELQHDTGSNGDGDPRSADHRHWDAEHSVLGYRENIFTFWDDPICDAFVFPSGLYVCGDARIRGTLSVVSGMNLSAVIDQHGERRPRPRHVHKRCTIQPPVTHGPWCFLHLTIRSADIFVQNSVEVTGSLYVKAARIEGGARVAVGLRGLVYTNERLVGSHLSRFAEEYATFESELQKRRRVVDRRASREERREKGRQQRSNTYSDDGLDDEDDNEGGMAFAEELAQYETRQHITYKDYLDIEARRSQLFHEPLVSATEKQHVMHSRSANGRSLVRFDKTFITMKEIETLRCPLIDTSGTIMFLRRGANGTFERQTTFSAPSPPTAATSAAAETLRSPHVMAGSDFTEFAAQRASYRYDDELTRDSPFGTKLPRLAYNTTIGDMITLSTVTVGNSGFLWVYGNFIGAGVLADDGADFHLHCGQFLTNISYPLGISVTKASAITAGGLLESVSSRVAAQTGSIVLFAGSAVVTKYVQVYRASEIFFGGELLTAVASISESGNLTVGSMAEIEMLMDVSDGSEVALLGSVALGLLQVADGSAVKLKTPPLRHVVSTTQNVRTVAVIEDALIVDGSSKIECTGTSLLIYNSLHVANASLVSVSDGDIFLQGHGSIRVVGSRLVVGGNCIAPHGSLLIGLGSTVVIRGSLRSSGLTAAEADAEMEHLAKQREREKSVLQEVDTQTGSQQWKIGTKNNQSSVAIQAINYTGSEKERVNTHHETSGSVDEIEAEKAADLAIIPRPALYVESSQLIVGGTIETLNSWTDITRKSTVTVGLGMVSRRSNSTLVHVRHGSKLTVSRGSFFPGIALLASGKSQISIKNGTVVSAGTVELREGSRLQCNTLRAVDDVSVSTDSEVHVSHDVVVEGALIAVSSFGRLTCKGISTKPATQEGAYLSEMRQKRGDLFVEDGASVHVLNGSLWTYGSAVAQDNGHIRVLRGNLIAVKGDVIAENYSEISVTHGAIILYSSHLRAVAEYEKDAYSVPAIDGKLDVESTPENNSTMADLSEILAPGIVSGDVDSLTSRYFPTSYVRHTMESVITASRIIPKTAPFQGAPATWTTSNMTATASVDDHRESREKLKTSLDAKNRVARQLHQPTEWDALLVARDSRTAVAISTQITSDAAK